MVVEPSKFKELLKRSRKKQGWSQEGLAEKIGATAVTINRWERGGAFPSLFYQQKLCAIFSISMEEFGFIKEEASEDKHYQGNHLSQNFSVTSSPKHSTLFFFSTGLPAPQELYNRVAERHTMMERTFNRSSTSIVGPRRIGKTWLIEYLLLEAKQQLGVRYRIGYVDATLASCATLEGFVARAIKVLGVALPENRQHPDLRTLEELVERFKSKNIFPILCIDEFDAFLGTKGIFHLNFFSSLRAMAQNGLILVIASRRPIIDIVGNDGMTSGFFNIFEQVTLEPFTLVEAQAFVEEKSKQANFVELERAALLKYGRTSDDQWPPIRLQLAGKILWEDKKLMPPDSELYSRLEDPNYWQKFEQRLEEKYRGVVR